MATPSSPKSGFELKVLSRQVHSHFDSGGCTHIPSKKTHPAQNRTAHFSCRMEEEKRGLILKEAENVDIGASSEFKAQVLGTKPNWSAYENNGTIARGTGMIWDWKLYLDSRDNLWTTLPNHHKHMAVLFAEKKSTTTAVLWTVNP